MMLIVTNDMLRVWCDGFEAYADQFPAAHEFLRKNIPISLSGGKNLLHSFF